MKKIIGLIFIFAALFCLAPTTYAAENLWAASVDGEVAMYISPNEESYKITTIPACSKMKLIKTERTWGLVEFNKKSGWINMSYTRSSYNDAAKATGKDAARKVIVSSPDNAATLYNVPSVDELLGSKVKYTVINDSILEIKRETQSGWGLVLMNKKYSWIQLNDTAPFKEPFSTEEYDTEYVYVLSKDGKGVEMWSDPEKTSFLLTIPDCTKLTVRAKEGEYIYVAHRGINGWIDYSCTTESLANAQNGAGTALNAEYTVFPEKGNSAQVMSIPSADREDGATVIANIKEGSSVFVQRSTVTGWCLINHKGKLGWISSKNLAKSENSKSEITQLLAEEKEGYVATEDSEGLQLYGTYNDDDDYETTIMPECVKVRVIAQKGNFEYVINDYAAGWVLKGNLTDTYEKALNAYKMDDDISYKTEKNVNVMSLPTNSQRCESFVVAKMKKNTAFNVIKIVETGDSDWGLTEVNGVMGWINLDNAQRTEIIIMDIVIMVAVILGIVLLAFGIIFFLKWRDKKKKKKEEDAENKEADEKISDEKEVEENAENVSDEGSESCEEAADVSGK